MSEESKISLIMPVYNCEKYLANCIESVLNQTYSNFELLINDDGSEDGSSKVCKSYADKDSRIRLFQQENGGLSSARNAMINKVTGEYVMFVDSDDIIAPDMLETLLNLIFVYKTDCASCRLLQVNEQAVPALVDKTWPVKVYDSHKYVEQMISSSSFGCYAVARLFKAEYIKNLNFPEGMIFEDLSAMPQMMIQMEKIVDIERPMYFYFQSPGSILRSSFSKRRTDALRAYYNLWQMSYRRNDYRLARIVIKAFLYKYYCYRRDVRINGLSVDEYRSLFDPYKKWFFRQLIRGKFISSTLADNPPVLWR